MDWPAFLLAFAAAIAFAFAVFNAAVKVNLIALGLLLTTSAWIWQLTHGGSAVHT